jgi:hypothetical protein
VREVSVLKAWSTFGIAVANAMGFHTSHFISERFEALLTLLELRSLALNDWRPFFLGCAAAKILISHRTSFQAGLCTLE